MIIVIISRLKAKAGLILTDSHCCEGDSVKKEIKSIISFL